MKQRKKFERICSGCGKNEMVRSDQIKNLCQMCSQERGGKRLSKFVKENKKSCAEAAKKHGMYKHRLYRIHKSMIERCHKMYHKYYYVYGGRGIHVCKQWLDSRESFFDWAFCNGYSDELTLDRIDNDLGYSPDNCRWVTRKQQSNNRRDNKSRVWSRNHKKCLKCQTTEHEHCARGLCKPCYRKHRLTFPSL